MSLEGLAVMVLVGGMGTRLRSVVHDRPKVMADVNGRPFLDFIFDYLQREGILQVNLLTGYLADMIKNHYGHTYGSITLNYIHESTPLGTGGAVRHALLLKDVKPSSCLVINGDTYFPVNLRKILTTQLVFSNLIFTTMVSEIERYGSLELESGTGRVRRFTEKGQRGPGLINAGTYFLQTEAILNVNVAAFSLERELLVPLAAAGKLMAIQDDSPFIDIGIPADYADFQANYSRL